MKQARSKKVIYGYIALGALVWLGFAAFVYLYYVVGVF